MIGGAKAHYDGIVAFSQTDFTEDLKKIITVPVLVMHGEEDQIDCTGKWTETVAISQNGPDDPDHGLLVTRPR